MNIEKAEIPKLIVSIIIPLIVGFIGSLATIPAIPTWYAILIKPAWTPPNWIFGPLWTTLYILMGITLFLVWRKGLARTDVIIAISVFGIQLFLNILWSFVFFGFQSIIGGLVEIALLWIAVFVNIIMFYRISKPAGILLLPYIMWVTIALYLNYMIYILNP